MPEPGSQRVQLGRDFPVDEAAALLRDGVLIPDYPLDKLVEAWRLNYEWALARQADDEAGGEGIGS